MIESSPSGGRDRCQRCGSLIHYSGRGRRPVWCSQVCRQEAYETRRAAREGGKPIEVVVLPEAPEPVTVYVDKNTIDDHVTAVIESPMATYRVIRAMEERARRGQLDHPKWDRVRRYFGRRY